MVTNVEAALQTRSMAAPAYMPVWATMGSYVWLLA